jgi:hypothetical protein
VQDKPADQPPASPPLPETPKSPDLAAVSLAVSAPEIGAPGLGKVLAAEPLTTSSPKVGFKPKVHHLDVPEEDSPPDASPAKPPASGLSIPDGFQSKRIMAALSEIYSSSWPNLPSELEEPDPKIAAKVEKHFKNSNWDDPPDRKTIYRFVRAYRAYRPKP